MSSPDGEESHPRTAPSAAGADRLLRLAQGYLSTALLMAALELGVFDRIAAGLRTPGEVAHAIRCDERGVRVLLDALAALGLLTASDAGYELTPLANTHLVSERSGYIGGVLSAYLDRSTWVAMGRLAEAVRRGGAERPVGTDSPQRWARMAAGLATATNPAAAALLDALEDWIAEQPALDVLDVGCGNGAIGHAVAVRHPTCSLTCVDWEEVLTTAQEHARRAGVIGRARFIAGNMLEVPLGGPYDMAILSQVLHGLSEQQVITMLRRAASVIRRTGRLVIHDYIANSPSPRAEPGPYVFSAILLATTTSGEARSIEVHRRMLRSAGLNLVGTRDVAGLPTRLLIAAHFSGGEDVPVDDRLG